MANNKDKTKEILRLMDLDFNQNEALVYTALREANPCKAGVIISKTGLHRNVVYTALEHLMQRKVVSVQTSRGGKVFTAIAPNILIEEYDYKKELAQELTEDFKKKNFISDQEISVHEGNDEYLKLLTSLINSLPRGASKYVLGTGGSDFMQYTMKPIWGRYHEVAKKQKINIKMLAYGTQRDALQETTNKEGIYEIKYLPQETENPAGIHIYPEIDTVLNIIYSNESQTVAAIKIKNKSLTQSYLNLFNNLWKDGKE
jgi:sugar-specific transcriptional regulator TrmB